ncbi:MAG: N-6 DNA methylase [Pseudomonadota bacterium]|nr:N-6 DNA methylase [Pseudomonadota bacterium]
MATNRIHRKREAQLAFEALSIEGSLLAPEWLAKASQLAATSQTEADYSVPRGRVLRDEIGCFWRTAQAHWGDFVDGRARKADRRELSERFVLALLRECFGFTTLASTEPTVVAERAYPVGFAALGGRVPVVIAPFVLAPGNGLETGSTAFGDGGRKRTAFGLAQEYLNAADGALWGIASDGLTLRIVRDNASLTRPAWIEADLARIFTEERYADFAALWLLAHQSRFGRADEPASQCALEAWRAAGREQGTRAREHLRRGVEDALVALGQGFLAHGDNSALRIALQEGRLSANAYFQQLLRLVYRLIFLLTVEERELLHAEDATKPAMKLYAEGYGLRRLRERSVKRSAHDRYTDLWETTRIVFRGVVGGEPRLGLPALAGLFAPTQCPALDAAKLENRALLTAVFRLSWLREQTGLSRVNWRDMGPEELGSVYESLLELVPVVSVAARSFLFATADEATGTARKMSGSYYTPEALVQAVLDTALEPVVKQTIAANPRREVAALLELSIVDPACGSGHFLLAAARRLAAHVARLQANGTPSAKEYRHALRQVVGRCIYGVDLNPMAVELCKVALWMEAIEPGLPLTFLDAHIQHGNALLGATPELMAKGIPDAAWEHIEGDDKAIGKAVRQRHKLGNLGLFGARIASRAEAPTTRRFEDEDDGTVDGLARKEAAFADWLQDSQDARFLADLWCAAFVWPLIPGPSEGAAPVKALWATIAADPASAPSVTRRITQELSERFGFFHWHIAFKSVVERGGFDVVLGNPPWDTLSPDAKEFFAAWEPEIRQQAREEQEATIARLTADQHIAQLWADSRRNLYATVHFLKESGRFTLYAEGNLGKGDFNVFRMFVEAALRLVRPGGVAAQVVPDGLYSGANTAAIRRHMLTRFVVDPLLGFENAAGIWFPGVHRSQKLCVYAARKGEESTPALRARFGIRTVPDLSRALAGDLLRIPLEMVREFSPDALAVMEFSSQLDIDIAAKMYSRWPKFGDESAVAPYRHYMREIDMGTDRELFDEAANGLPLYEGRMVTHYDHRAKGYREGRGRSAEWEDLPFGHHGKGIQPQWHIPLENVPSKTLDRLRRYRVGWCDVTGAANVRTLLAALLPPHVLAGDSVPNLIFPEPFEWALCTTLAAMNTMCVDYIVRKKVGSHVKYNHMDSLPLPRLPKDHPAVAALVPRVLALTCTGPEMTPFWNAMATHGWVEPVAAAGPVPGLVDEEARVQVEAEIEVIFARDLFGLSRQEIGHILDTFPIVERRQRQVYGEYRTKRLVLEIYDAMAEATRTGVPYATRLSPPPADPSVAHPPRTVP